MKSSKSREAASSSCRVCNTYWLRRRLNVEINRLTHLVWEHVKASTEWFGLRYE